MRAVVFAGPREVVVAGDHPEPLLAGPRDAIVRVTHAAICGTDLHPYRGEIPGFAPGTVLGHEFTGTVVAAGDLVPFRPGTPVLASDLIACGRCPACAQAAHYQCAEVSLFGYSTVVGPPVPGGQADLVRVPYSDVVLCSRPDDLSAEAGLLVSDTLSTAFAAVQAAGVRPGHTVAVVGGGTVGLLSAMCARLAGASRVLVADPLDARRAIAAELGFDSVMPDELAVPGRGADAVIEAVGSYPALACAVSAAGPRAVVAVAGAHHGAGGPFPAGHAFARELTVTFVVGDPIAIRSQVIELVRAGQLDPAAIISHRLPLADAVAGYDLFDRAVASKVVLNVS